MHLLKGFFWLGSQAVGHPYFLIPAAVCLGVAMYLAGCKASDWKRVPHKELQLLIVPGVIALLMLACGAIFASERTEPSELGQWLVVLLALLELPVAAWAIYRLPGVRVVATLLVLPQLWMAFWIFIVSYMSVTGTWL